MKKDVCFIGMDLGTFKTSVASSTGAREVVFSAVGTPRDHISRSILGRDHVFGPEIVSQRLALNVTRPFEKGALKFSTHEHMEEDLALRKEAARLLVEHAVDSVHPPKGSLIYGIIGAPSRATVANKKVILDAARTSFDAVMIVSEPFSIAYGMNRLTDTIVIDIGAGTIDLCPIYGTLPTEEDQVTLPLGGDYIDEQFFNLIRQAYPHAQLSLNMAREFKEKFGFVHDVNEAATVVMPVKGKPQSFDITGALKKACRLIVPPIIEGLQELIARFDPEFQSRYLQNIILGGGGSQLKGLDGVIEEALKEYGGGKVKKVGDAVYAGAVGALKLAMNMPMSCWQELHSSSAESRKVAV